MKGNVGFYDTDSGSFSLFINPLEYENGFFIDNSDGLYFCNVINVQRLHFNLNFFGNFRKSFFEYVYGFDYGVAGFFSYGADKHKFWASTRAEIIWIRNSRLIVYPDVASSIHKVFKKVDEITLFAIDKIRLSKDLKGFLEVRLDDFIELPAQRNDSLSKVGYKFLALCYHAFLLGMDEKIHSYDKIKYLDFPENKEQLLQIRLDRAPMSYSKVLEYWYEIGVFLREN